MPLGVAVRLVFGTFNIKKWSEYCAEATGQRTLYDYSHLNSIAGDINPLNGLTEP